MVTLNIMPLRKKNLSQKNWKNISYRKNELNSEVSNTLRIQKFSKGSLGDYEGESILLHLLEKMTTSFLLVLRRKTLWGESKV